MIRVQVDAMIPDHIQLRPMFSAVAELREQGVEFVDDNPDLLLLHTYRQTKEYIATQLDRGIPTVLLERIASANVHSTREISRPNVGAVAKSTTFRDWRLNNEPRIRNRYHFQIMDSEAGDPPPILIDESGAAKIELWYHFGFYSMMQPFISAEIEYELPRRWAASFAGTTLYGSGDPLVSHRESCCREMERGPHECYVARNRAMNKSRYVDLLRASYTSPSPWGLGEKCYRDFEGIFAGSVVIKPDTHFVLDLTDTYHRDNRFIHTCAMDYSDLNERIAEVVDNWGEFADRCRAAREKMVGWCTDKKFIASIVHNVFEKALDRC